MKTQPSIRPIPVYGSVVGFLVGVLAPMVYGFLVARNIGIYIFLSIFAGPLGAILGAYIAVFWKTIGPERKQLTDTLFPMLGGVIGVILAFWIPAVMIFPAFDDAFVGVFYGGCVGTVMAPLGAAGGKYLAKYLMKVRSDEENTK